MMKNLFRVALLLVTIYSLLFWSHAVWFSNIDRLNAIEIILMLVICEVYTVLSWCGFRMPIIGGNDA